MSFIKDIFDTLLGEPVSPSDRPSTLWDTLAGETNTLNLNGVSNLDQSPPTNYGSAGRNLPSEQLAAIIQNRYRAFSRFDINPMLLTTGYRAQVAAQRLYDLVGYESDNYNGNQGKVYTGSDPIVGWRTVEIAFSGDFIKFEFMPGQVNSNVSASYDGTVPDNFTKPAYSQLANVGSDLAGAASSRQVLIQFDDTASPLLIMKDGDVIKTPFERVFVTFKYYVPRFSLIVGYNAEIISSDEHKQLNAKPAYGGGYSLWSNDDRHCTPFSYVRQGWNPADFTYNVKTLAANSTDNFPIFDLAVNPSVSGNSSVYGQAVGWITQITLDITNIDTTAANRILGVFAIGVVPDSSVASANTFGRVLHFSPFYLLANSSKNIVINFDEPLRFVLTRQKTNAGGTSPIASNASRLLAKVINGATSGATLTYDFSVTGYTWGKWKPGPSSALVPGTMEAVTTSPFPLDYLD